MRGFLRELLWGLFGWIVPLVIGVGGVALALWDAANEWDFVISAGIFLAVSGVLRVGWWFGFGSD